MEGKIGRAIGKIQSHFRERKQRQRQEKLEQLARTQRRIASFTESVSEIIGILGVDDDTHSQMVNSLYPHVAGRFEVQKRRLQKKLYRVPQPKDVPHGQAPRKTVQIPSLGIEYTLPPGITDIFGTKDDFTNDM